MNIEVVVVFTSLKCRDPNPPKQKLKNLLHDGKQSDKNHQSFLEY
jgi:hypothetical protein